MGLLWDGVYNWMSVNCIGEGMKSIILSIMESNFIHYKSNLAVAYLVYRYGPVYEHKIKLEAI